MKKTLIALAAFAAVSSFAQSTVTLFGGADLNFRSVETGVNKFSGMSQDGIYSSRLGVMGTEDLGGGLKANFHFEGALTPDDGSSKGLTFQRKSIIGVSGNFGEVRLGRDYTPAFTVLGFDPFGTNGVGSAGNLMFSTIASGTSGVSTFVAAQASSTAAASVTAVGVNAADPSVVRANNGLAYYSPSFSGVTVAAMYGFGVENANVAKDQAKVTSVKIAYANGPVSVAYANQQTKGGFAATDNQKWTTNVIGASYDFQVAKAHFINREDKLSIPTGEGKLTTRLFGVSAPVGALTLKASYITKTTDTVDAGKQIAFGGVYDLSKRTAVYGTYSKLTNEVGFGNSVGSAVASDFTGLASTGFEMGVKHSF